MRRPVTVAMSVLTVGVAGLSLRSSTHDGGTIRGSAAQLAPAGVTEGGTSSSRPHRSARKPTSGARRGHKRQSGSSSVSAPVNVTGQGEQTPYGPLQVEITVSHDRIVAARTLVHPEGGHSSEVNAYAVPMLDHETVHSQGRQVDAVSGATFTSEAYQQSLQAALDAAHQHHLM